VERKKGQIRPPSEVPRGRVAADVDVATWGRGPSDPCQWRARAMHEGSSDRVGTPGKDVSAESTKKLKKLDELFAPGEK
jgi:hypothetical protein